MSGLAAGCISMACQQHGVQVWPCDRCLGQVTRVFTPREATREPPTSTPSRAHRPSPVWLGIHLAEESSKARYTGSTTPGPHSPQNTCVYMYAYVYMRSFAHHHTQTYVYISPHLLTHIHTLPHTLHMSSSTRRSYPFTLQGTHVHSHTCTWQQRICNRATLGTHDPWAGSKLSCAELPQSTAAQCFLPA